MRGVLTMRRHRRHSSRIGALAIALVLVLVTACGGNEADEVAEDPESSLRDAVEAIADWQGIALELRLEADEAGQQALLTEGDMTQEDLDLLLGGRVLATIAHLDDPETTAFEARIRVDDGELLELRVTDDQRFFVRADLEAVPETSDGELLAQEDLDDLVSMAEMMGVGEAGRALAESRWIELTGIEQLLALAGVSPEDDTEEVDEATAERIAARTSTFIEEDVTVTTVGSDDIGERVRATTDGAALQRFLDDISAELDDGGLIDEAGGQELTDELSEDTVVSLDAWIDGGELRQLAIDLTTLDEEMELDGEVWLIVAMEEFTGSIDAPEDATTLDVFSLVGGFFGGGLDGFGDDDFDDGFDDGFEDDGFEDGFEDDGFGTEEGFEDDGFGTEEGFEDEGTDDGFGDDGTSGADASECITQEELDEIENFLGEEGLEEIQNLIDAGFLEVC
jgi:hypothetical protein